MLSAEELQKAKDSLVEAEIEVMTEVESIMARFVTEMQAVSAKLPKGGIPSHVVSFVDKIAANADNALKGELAIIKQHYAKVEPAPQTIKPQ